MKIGIFSNVHDNYDALQKALNLIRKEKCELIVCLGDMVGSTVPHCLEYFNKRNSTEILKTIKSKCDIVVAGNHDLNAVGRVPKYPGEFKYPKNWPKLDYYSKKEFSNGRVWLYEHELPTLLNRENRLYLIGLPEIAFKNLEDYTVMFSHFAYPDASGSTTITYRNSKYLKKHFKYMEIHKSKISISGHEHIDGMMVFTENSVEDIPFDQEFIINTDIPCWITGPAVCFHKDKMDGIETSSGVMIFDTKKKSIIAKTI